MLPIIFGFERAKIWYQKRQEKKEKPPSKRNERGKQIWNKYGLPGLALLGPILTGIHIAAFLAMTLGARKINTTVWITVSLGVWTLVFGLATVFGLDIFIQ
ncbi:hypothetical protein [Oceanobacillus polygoni]|uniref:Small multi-drug export protein n=1 Tax=Oceanobacillus polygoni TaxID=1235259 RepID=A0A9X1CLQ3_9BACI|nr:hypothetical protein [Oceanobacillus polygoni]